LNVSIAPRYRVALWQLESYKKLRKRAKAIYRKQYDRKTDPSSTVFWVQPVRPFHHSAHLLSSIEKFMKTNQATWPVERALLTTGTLDAIHISRANGGEWLETPYLDVRYTTNWDWTQPPPPPPAET